MTIADLLRLRVRFEAEAEVSHDNVQRILRQPIDRAKLPPSRGEREVLFLVAEGFTDQEIADAREVAVDTVKTQVKFLFLKLQACNRAHAVANGYRQGLLPC